MNLNGYKTQKTHRNKQTFIKGNMGVPPWNGQSQMSLGGLNLVYERSTKTNSVNKRYPRPINLQHQQRQNNM